MTFPQATPLSPPSPGTGPISEWWTHVDGKVYAYTSTGVYTASENFTLTSSNRNPVGIAWDGSYFRVADNPDDKVYAYTSDGVYTASENFNMVGVNGYPIGITWDGAYLRVLDSEDDKVYAYSSTGTYVQSASFDLDPANADASGITWDGAYLRVVDSIDDKVYAYTSDGVYTASENFNLDGDNVDPRGITWDGAYLRVVDTREDKVYAYEGIPPGPLTNFGLSDDADYEGAFSTTVVAHGAWKCLSSSVGESFTINNAALTLHGFCVQERSGGGLEVEVHLPPTSSYADLKRMADATGSWSFFLAGVFTSQGPRIYDDTVDRHRGPGLYRRGGRPRAL